ncbi:MAG TPA: hypothetical protein VK666_30205 [Chryseolinea sp.]|nr:hypothetical protein [Chryseolinea sp.]
MIGAIIELGNCLNLIEPMSLNVVAEAHHFLEKIFSESGEKMPLNNKAIRRLDCTVIRYVHEINKKFALPTYDTIRSAFVEGDPIYPGSNFTERLHIEICVINADLIKGFFLPRPINEFNPFLS